MIGSEGTLGIITAATIQLLPQPAPPVTYLFAMDQLNKLPQLLEFIRKEQPHQSFLKYSPKMP